MRTLTMLTLYAGPDRVVQAGATEQFDDDEAAALVAGGYATYADKARAAASPSGPPADVGLEDPAVAARAAELGKLTIPQLKDHADERDISLPPDGKKAELVAAILQAEQQAAATQEE